MEPTTMERNPADSNRELTLRGTVERVVFRSPDGSWSVVRLSSGKGEQTTVVGALPPVEPGEHLEVHGLLELKPKFGLQLRARQAQVIAPNTKEGLRRFLSSKLIPGVGKALAERLIAEFGDQVLKIGIETPQELARVSGIGIRRAEAIGEALRQHAAQHEALVILQGGGVNLGLAQKIVAAYGEKAATTITEDPYRLSLEFHGVGFYTADRLALSMGTADEAPSRIAAGIHHVLMQAAEQGHTFLPSPELTARAEELLAVSAELVGAGVATLSDSKLVCVEDSRIYLSHLWLAEHNVANRLKNLMRGPSQPLKLNLDRAVAWFEKREEIHLAQGQQQAIRLGLSEKVLVVTGGPGTGKTTLVRGIVEVLRSKKQRVLLAGPTGRAAKRLQLATGFEARTLHRLLEFDPGSGGFARNLDRPLRADLVLVDEASMVDIQLMRSLLEAIPATCRLVLIGDVNQLPSVGPGRVLHDVIESQSVPVVRLTEIYRQAANSRIISNAHRILHGNTDLDAARDSEGDFYWIHRQEPDEILDTLSHLVTVRLPQRFDLDPKRDIQVLTPMRKGSLGIENLNLLLQQLHNPQGDVLPGRAGLRVGDRVMQTRNNYELAVYNGDVGEIASATKDTILVRLEDREVTYKASELDQVVLAYACSVHKAQGSEYPCVVLPLHTQHYVMLLRNLLYTGVTRGSRLVVLLGSKRAVETAIRTHRPSQRHTYLKQRLLPDSVREQA